METISRFWLILEEQGYRLGEPRPRFDSAVERVMQDEVAAEEAHGEKEPDPVPELSRNVRLVEKGGAKCLLYVIDSAFDRGFWGAGIADLAELQAQPLPWALVLLHGDATRGYWFDAAKVRRLAKRWNPIVPGGPNYELTHPAQTDEATAFESESALLRLVGALTSVR
jgi:hypothetical protein